jgi:flagellar basal body-associated protein FliL
MKIKIILFAVLLAYSLVICWLSADLARTKKHLADAEDLIEIQHNLIEKLGSLDAINATINVEVNNKATFGSVKAGDVEVIADQILHYTRKELLTTDTLCKTISQLYQ